MEPLEKADVVFDRSVREALGYIELARMQSEMGADNQAMLHAALVALQRFSNDDDLIDAMYDEWHGGKRNKG